MPQPPNRQPPNPETVERALAFCRARGSFIFREVQTHFNFGRDELVAVVTGHIGQMIRYGRVQKTGKDQFRWVGQA
ncbi:MAG TPA: hypothetical protein VNH15_07125 [Elusimicrobiota bacterium]|nr:hypothetical protein [Elusimicrobiota bacterium]